MMLYYYRLEGEKKGCISLDPAVDLWYWKKQGQRLDCIYRARSVKEAWSCIQRKKTGNATVLRLEELQPAEEPAVRRCLKKAGTLFSLLAGRGLLWQEVIQWVEKHQLEVNSTELRKILQVLLLQGKCELKPGVVQRGSVRKWRCERCLYQGSEIRVSACSTCGEECAVCEHCILMGRSRACTPFFLFQPVWEKPDAALSPPLPISLTRYQENAMMEIKRELEKNRKQILVWAVTGAGKTELMLPIVKKWLDQGKRVLWATPRKDVVLELFPRLKAALAGHRVIALYGGSDQRFTPSAFVLATCHQVWRFYRFFDLMIIDEVDAFPLYGDVALEAGLHRALFAGGQQILLTATPPDHWQRFAKNRKLPTVILPVRYHGMPLPLPQLFRETGLWAKMSQKRSIRVLARFLQQLDQQHGQALIFVPRIQDVHLVISWLKEHSPHHFKKAKGVYSRHPQREKIIQEYRDGKWTVLVTTTILERGVTVPRCHVLVLGAEHPVFDETALVQIAGRVGRSANYQKGVVWFLAQERTDAQRQAQKRIKKLNEFVQKEGIGQKGAYM